MSIVTLTTDWHQSDYYLGAVKGRILSMCPLAGIVDISHHIQPFNIAQAAFVLRNTFTHFPEGTIHMILVKVTEGPERSILAIRSGKHIFIGSDNGVFGLLLREEPEKIIRIEGKPGPESSPFDLVLFMVEKACALLSGEDLSSLGEEVDSYDKRTPMRATIDDAVINGSVIYIDSYQNAITNISRDLFERVGKGRPYDILVQSNYHRIKNVSTGYSDAPAGEMLALFNSLGLLEVAINNGNAADLLNLSVGSTIRVKFGEKK